MCAQLVALPVGVYHFSQRLHALHRPREGDCRLLLSRSADDEEVACAAAVLVLTSVWQRNAWKYGARAYRHVYWDAGTVLSRILATTAAYGIRARVVLGFVDREVVHLLDLDADREFPVALVALGERPDPHACPYSRHEAGDPRSGPAPTLHPALLNSPRVFGGAVGAAPPRRARSKSPSASPCRYSSGNRSETSFVRRANRGIRLSNRSSRPRTRGRRRVMVPMGGRQLPRLAVAVPVSGGCVDGGAPLVSHPAQQLRHLGFQGRLDERLDRVAEPLVQPFPGGA